MKKATKKATAKGQIMNEADIIGSMMVYTEPRTKEDLQFMAERFAKRKAVREATSKKKQSKPILQKFS